MESSEWLALNEYSHKYDVSVSTLRRRIKKSSLKFKLDQGKYFLIDEPLPKKALGRPRQGHEDINGFEETKPVAPTRSPEIERESIFPVAHRLLEEIKKAYTIILQEKEEQILQLKEESIDLRTLVRVLEGENARLTDQLRKLNRL